MRFSAFPSLFVLAAFAAGCTGTTDRSISAYGAAGTPMTICSGFGCAIKDEMAFSAADRERFAVALNGAADADAERAALRKTIGLMEAATRSNLRQRADNPFSYQIDRGKRGQMDCEDESLNTTRYLTYLQGEGLLKFHKVNRNYANRGILIDGRYPHKSARMQAVDGSQWAVDPWKTPTGGLAEIMPLSQWYGERNSASQYE